MKDIVAAVKKAWRKTQSVKKTSVETGIPYPRVRRILVDANISMTERDRQIMGMRDSGMTREEIAYTLGISPHTVDARLPYRRKMYTKESAVTKWRRKKENGPASN